MTVSPTHFNFQSWVILLAIGVLIFLMNIDYTAVNLALLPIAEEMGGELNTLQWLLSGYVLIWSALVVPAGRFADIHGKRFSLNLGVGIFILGSLVTAFGHNVPLLIMGRLIQGLGAALFSSPAYSLIFSSVPANKQGMAIGFMGGAAGLGLAIGPTFAGWVIKEIGWRWIFYINLPLGLLVMLVLWGYAAPEKKLTETVRVDWPSALLLTGGLGSLVFALNQIEVWGIGDPTLLSFGISGLGLLFLFARRDRQQPFQFLPPTIVYNASFMSIIAVGFIVSYGFALVLVLMGLYLQNSLGLSSNEAGIYFLAMTVAVGVLSPIGGKLADHMDVRIPIVTGLVLTICALFTLSQLDASSSAFRVCSGLLLAGLGLGISFPSMNTGMFRTLTPAEINTGSAIFTMSITLGNASSVIASTSFLVLFGRSKLVDLIGAAGLSLSFQDQHTVASIINKVGRPSDQWAFSHLLGIIDQAFLYGFRLTLWIGIGLSTLAIGIFLKYFDGRNRIPTTPAPIMV